MCVCVWVYLNPYCNGVMGGELRRVRDSGLSSFNYFVTLGKSLNLYALLIPHMEDGDGAPFFTCWCPAQIRARAQISSWTL